MAKVALHKMFRPQGPGYRSGTPTQRMRVIYWAGHSCIDRLRRAWPSRPRRRRRRAEGGRRGRAGGGRRGRARARGGGRIHTTAEAQTMLSQLCGAQAIRLQRRPPGEWLFSYYTLYVGLGLSIYRTPTPTATTAIVCILGIDEYRRRIETFDNGFFLLFFSYSNYYYSIPRPFRSPDSPSDPTTTTNLKFTNVSIAPFRIF